MSGPVEVPHCLESERYVLGAMLEDGPTLFPLALVEYQVSERDFYIPAHAIIFMALRSVYETHPSVMNAPLVMDRLRNAGNLEQVGGMAYLMDLIQSAPLTSPEMVRVHFEQVKNYGLIRQGIAVARNVIEDGYKATDGKTFLMQAPALFYEQLPRRRDEEDVGKLLDSAFEFWERISLLPEGHPRPLIGLSTDIYELDQITNGLQPGLNLLAGRPSAGKTSLEGTIAANICKAGLAVARIGNDMSKRMTVIRDGCRESGVSISKLNKGFAGKHDLEKFREAKARIREWPMHLECGMHDVREICTWARLMKARHDIRLLTIDYIQQVKAPYLGPRVGEHEEISEVSSKLKKLSFELDIPVLALAQFNREGEQNKRKPQLSDLRGSGSLEQDAAMCMFLYKSPDYEYSNRDGDYENKRRAVVLEVAKQQNGETGNVEVWFHCPYFNIEAAEPNWGRDFK